MVFRLKNKVYANLSHAGKPLLLRTFDDDSAGSVDDVHRDLLTQVAQGIAPDEAADTEGGRALVELGIAKPGLDPVDPHARKQLVAVGASEDWKIRGLPEAELLEDLVEMHARRKMFAPIYGQTSCLPQSAIARLHTIRTHVPQGARIALIGDDDLLAIPLFRYGYRVTVFDIDDDLLRFEGVLAQEQGADIELVHQNLLAPLPDNIAGQFDAAFTDPISHQNCLTVFLGRAFAVTKPGGHVFCACYPQSRWIFHEVYSTLPGRILDIHEIMTSYYGHAFSEVDYQSDLIVIGREEGALPIAPDAPMPDIDVTYEELPWPMVGFIQGRSGRLSLNRLTADDLAGAWVSAGHQVAQVGGVDAGDAMSARLLDERDRAVVFRTDRKRKTTHAVMYPSPEEIRPEAMALDMLLKSRWGYTRPVFAHEFFGERWTGLPEP